MLLATLKEQYAQALQFIHQHTVDELMEHLREAEAIRHRLLTKRGLNAINQIAIAALNIEISKYQSYLRVKGRFGNLKPLDELLQDEQMLMEVFNDL